MADDAPDQEPLPTPAAMFAEALGALSSAAVESQYQYYLLECYGAEYLDGFASQMYSISHGQASALTNLAGAWQQFAEQLAAALAGLKPYDFAAWLRDTDQETAARAEAFGEHVITLLDTLIVANR